GQRNSFGPSPDGSSTTGGALVARSGRTTFSGAAAGGARTGSVSGPRATGCGFGVRTRGVDDRTAGSSGAGDAVPQTSAPPNRMPKIVRKPPAPRPGSVVIPN